MEQKQNCFRPGAATDEPASSSNPVPGDAAGPIVEDEGPVFSSDAEQAAYWQGVTAGIRTAGREPGHPHMPADFDLSLTRDGAGPGLVSSSLLEAWPHNPHDADPALPSDPKTRHDGWDAIKERCFLSALADTGVVADACRACKMSRDAAYAYRRRASGRAFALGWDAALLIARGRVADDVMSRSVHGVIDRVYRNGELVAERHRYDNRLTMAVLARLDRLAEGLGENAPVVRAVAQEFDRFLDILPEGVEGAAGFVAARFPAPQPNGVPSPVREPPAYSGASPPAGTEQALLARLGAYRDFGVGLPAESGLEGLDPADMEGWTDEQWERAEFAGLLKALQESQWPQAARRPGPDEADGICKLRKFYLFYHPEPADEPAAPEKDDFAGRSVWQEEDGLWVTDFPPAPGYEGWEEGEPGDERYRRRLTVGELAAIGLGPDGKEAEQPERAERLAGEHAARDRYFCFDGGVEPGESDAGADAACDIAEPGGGGDKEAP